MKRTHAWRSGRDHACTLASCLLLGALAWLSPTGRVRAFSDIERFPAPVAEGGGGGRLFTGSPVDGYACSVCHEGGVEPNVAIFGLPPAGYVPGQTYEIQVVWDGAVASHAMHIEFLDERTRRAAGSVALVDPATIDASGRCGGRPEEKPADYIIEGQGRQIIGVQGCGSSRLRFRFTAPNLREVVLAGSVVRSNSKASADGDGVQNLNRILRRAGEPNPADSGCALAVAPRAGVARWLAVLALLGSLLRWRARRRRLQKAQPQHAGQLQHIDRA
jgi:hypothetical protein